MTETYKEISNGQIELSVTFVDKDGRSTQLVEIFPIQGGVVEVKEENPPVSYVQTKISPFEWYVTILKDGIQIATRHKNISKDGKTNVHTINSVDPQGKPVVTKQVFEKQ